MEDRLTMHDINKFRALHLRRQQFDVKQFGGITGLIIGHAPNGGLTILYRRLTENVVQYAIARCSLEDRYERALGRRIAMHKLVEGRGKLLYESMVNELPGDVKPTTIQNLQALVKQDKALMCNLRVTQACIGGGR